jgi:hypothetical protein
VSHASLKGASTLPSSLSFQLSLIAANSFLDPRSVDVGTRRIDPLLKNLGRLEHDDATGRNRRFHAFVLPLAFAISQRRHPAVGPSAPQSARLSDARVTLTGDDIAPSADSGISRRPSPPQASTRTLRIDFQMGASIPTYSLSKRTGNGATWTPR